ncbi:MAG TPA: proprotein convertase P-domain-containing protein, partial [Chitinophagaceae bacterium]|nr:proprotein convertase P-domain-containing protein [Chitinophagaceae bacterium]
MKMTSFFAALIILASSNFDPGSGELNSVVEKKQANRLSRPWIDQIISSGTINLSIPDENANGIVHLLNVSGIPAGSVVDSIIIGFSVDHTWLQDVVINLEAPNGRIFNLVANRGESSTYGFQNVYVTSDNSKPAFPSGYYGNPLSGTYRADAKTQSTLDSDPANNSVITAPSVNTTTFTDLFSIPNGDWKIRVYDVYGGDVGILSDWSIKVSYHDSGDLPPSVTINQGASQTDPTSASPILFTVTFSEAVTGFATGDVTLSGTAGATTA